MLHQPILSPFLTSFTNTHSEHLSDLPNLSEAVNLIANQVQNLNLDEVTTYLIPKVQLHCVFEASIENLRSIDLSAQAKHFSAVEALSRISIEMSANARVLYSGDLRENARSFVRHYIKTKASSTEKWLKFAKEKNLIESKAVAQSILSNIEIWKDTIPWLNEIGTTKWPNNIREKFVEIREEEAYLTAFAGASDSVHTLSEDVFNQSINATLYSNGIAPQFKAMQAEKASYAIYLYAFSVTFFYNTIAIFSSKYGLKINESESARCHDILKKINNKHHSTFMSFQTAQAATKK